MHRKKFIMLALNPTYGVTSILRAHISAYPVQWTIRLSPNE